MTSASVQKTLAFLVSAVVVCAVVTAILLDPPGVQRQRRMDGRRIEDLLSMERAAEEYWNRHKVLPPDLAALAKEPGLRVPEADPETGSPYVYEVTGPKSYRLCAVFARFVRGSLRPVLLHEMGGWRRPSLFRPDDPGEGRKDEPLRLMPGQHGRYPVEDPHNLFHGFRDGRACRR